MRCGTRLLRTFKSNTARMSKCVYQKRYFYVFFSILCLKTTSTSFCTTNAYTEEDLVILRAFYSYEKRGKRRRGGRIIPLPELRNLPRRWFFPSGRSVGLLGVMLVSTPTMRLPRACACMYWRAGGHAAWVTSGHGPFPPSHF
jgi:hypothetical protein